MRDNAILVQIEQLARLLETELTSTAEHDYLRVCRLTDAKEYVRRAWHAVDDSAFAPNDTAYETPPPAEPDARPGADQVWGDS